MLDNKQARKFITKTKPANKSPVSMAQLAARYCKKKSGLPAKYLGTVKYEGINE